MAQGNKTGRKPGPKPGRKTGSRSAAARTAAPAPYHTELRDVTFMTKVQIRRGGGGNADYREFVSTQGNAGSGAHVNRIYTDGVLVFIEHAGEPVVVPLSQVRSAVPATKPKPVQEPEAAENPMPDPPPESGSEAVVVSTGPYTPPEPGHGIA